MKRFPFILFLVTVSFNAVSQVPVDGLVSYFPFNDSAVDVMDVAIVGKVEGAAITSDRFGVEKSAFLFDGNNDHIQIDNFSDLNPDNQISFSIWAQALSSTSNCMLMLYPDNNSDRCVTCAQYKGTIYWDYGDIFNNGRMSVHSIPFDTSWHHYVYQINLEQGVKEVYMDGVLLKSESTNNTLSNLDRSLWIGGGTDANPGDIRFHGRIDDIRIYNRLLDSIDVQSLYKEVKCINNVIVYDTIPVYDTVWVTLYNYISVTDTLIIDAVFTGLDSEPFNNRLKVYPNPARTKIFINTGEEFEKMSGHTIRIVTPSGKVVYVSTLFDRLIELSVDDLGSPGLYILQIIDSDLILVTSKKILLE